MLDFTLDFPLEQSPSRAEAAAFDLRRVMDCLAAMVGPKAEDKGLQLVFIEPPGLATALVGDGLGLLHALVRLACDAIRFTEHGEVVIGIEQLARQSNSCELRFVVRGGETGPETGPETEPVADGSDGVARSGGLALGLEAAEQLVAQLGASLTLRLSSSNGGEFGFSLSFGCQPASQESNAPPTGLAGTRVLVVDASTAARRAFLGVAAPLGLIADAAADVREALRAVRSAMAASRPFDAVFIDAALPGTDGLACAWELVEASGGACPVALMTSLAGRDSLRRRVEASGLAVSGLVVKPMTPARLVEACTAVTGLASRQTLATHAAGLDAFLHRERLSAAGLLLVEDNDINAELVTEILRGAGIAATRAHDGREALRMLESRPFDGVLLDCQLPGGTAWQLARSIRDNARWQTLPIIAMSANATLADRARALAAGMTELTAKPIDANTLFGILAAWVPTASVVSAAPAPGDGLHPIPRIDAPVDRALANDHLYRRLMLRFREVQLDFTAQFRRARNVADPGVAARLVHDLRALAGALGVLGVERSAASLEAALAGRDDLSGIEGPLGALLEEMRRVNLGLRHLASD